MNSAGSWFERWRGRPFGRLTAHFFQRFFGSESGAGDSDARFGVGPMLGLVAVPGAILSLILFKKYSPLVRWLAGVRDFNPDLASLPDKFNFVVFAMTLTGVVTLLKWDTLFPDRRDFANLLPLPVDARWIFLAKLLALGAFLAAFATPLNLFSTFLFPAVVLDSQDHATFGELAGFIAGHAASMMCATVFTFSVFLAITGSMMAVLPYAWFRRISRYVQFAAMSALMLGFFLSPMALPSLERMRTGADSDAGALPPVWFLGLYLRIQGKDLGFEHLASTAVFATAIAAFTALAVYAASYRRFFLRSAEMQELPMPRRRFGEWLFAASDRVLLSGGFERGGFRYAVRTLFRAERHAAVIAASLGLGMALAVQSAISARPDRILGNPAELSQDALAVPLTIIYFAVAGFRLAFGMAADERANWVFQSAGARGSGDTGSLARKTMLALSSPVILGTGAVYLVISTPLTALLHAAFVGSMTTLLTEIALREFRTLPCTCPFLPGRTNVVAAVAGVFLGYVVFARALSGIEAWMLQSPPRFAGFYIVAGMAWYLMRRSRDREGQIVYQQPAEGIQLLRLAE